MSCLEVAETEVEFKGYKCRVELSRYHDGTTAVTLIDDEGLVAVASVNMTDFGVIPEYLPNYRFFCKDWSENEGMVQALVKAGVAKELGEVIEVNPWGSKAHFMELLRPIPSVKEEDTNA